MATKKSLVIADGTTLSSNRKATPEYEILARLEAVGCLIGTVSKGAPAGQDDTDHAFSQLSHT